MLEEEEEHFVVGDQVAADERGEAAAESEGCCWVQSAAAVGASSALAHSPYSLYPSNLEEVYPPEVGPGCTFGRKMLLP